jgi:hypothetical protein
VGGRARPLLALNKPLTAHQSPFFTYTVRAGVASYDNTLGPDFRSGKYDALVLWKWWTPSPELWADVPRHYRFVKKLPGDPLIGLEVSLWERISATTNASPPQPIEP